MQEFMHVRWWHILILILLSIASRRLIGLVGCYLAILPFIGLIRLRMICMPASLQPVEPIIIICIRSEILFVGIIPVNFIMIWISI